MARTWRDCAETLAELAERVPDLDRRAAALSITAQGDGCWLVDAAGEPIGGGLLWLDSRAAGLVDDYRRSDAYPRHYELTGSGVNACMASSQMAWMKRHQPERLARAAVCFHCKDWLYFRLTGERVTDPSEGIFTFGDFRTQDLQAGDSRRHGNRRLPRLLAADRRRLAARPSVCRPPRADATGLPEGLPGDAWLCRRRLHGARRRPLRPSGRVGCSIFGSTGMHMRYVPTVADVTLNEARSGYTMSLPDRRASRASMQSNMAATLNIDWLLDIACEAAELAGTRTSRKSLLDGLDATDPRRPAGSGDLSSLHPRGRRARAVPRRRTRGRSSSASRRGSASSGSLRAVYEGLAFAARDCYAAIGAAPEEVRLGGGAARSEALRSILAGSARTPVSGLVARGDRGCGRGHDGRRLPRRSIPTWRPALKTGSSRRSGDDSARSGASPAVYDGALSRSIARRARPCPRPGTGFLNCGARTVHERSERHAPRSRSSATASCCPRCSRRPSARRCGDELDDPDARACPGPTSRWSMAMPRPGMDGLKEYQGDPDEIVALRRRRRDPGHPARAVLGRHAGPSARPAS